MSMNRIALGFRLKESIFQLRSLRSLQSRQNAEICRYQPVRKYYNDFGHNQKLDKVKHPILFILMGIGVLGAFIDYEALMKLLKPVAKAAEKSTDEIIGVDAAGEDKQSEEKEGTGEQKKKKKKGKVNFRDQKIIEYENRVRAFSTPDKVFRYFATVRLTSVEATEIYMTPDDFLRAITPGIKQPNDLGLDHYRRYDPKSLEIKLGRELPKDSIFYKLGSAGLITFSDYIFLLTVLSICIASRRHFEIAFRMFDLNGDGDVDSDEFGKVATLIRQQSNIGNRHQTSTGNLFKGVNSALTTYFFGPTLKEKLTIEKFLEFQEQLQNEILTLEFQRRNPDKDGNIAETDFTELLLAYAGYTDEKKVGIIKRVKKTFKNKPKGISKEEYLEFFHFLNNINDVDTALTFYHIAGASIDQATLKHVARTVAHVELSDHIVQVVYTIFDENKDGQLSNKEFIAVMKNRLLRGLEKPKDTSFMKLLMSMMKCVKSTYLKFNK